MQELPIRAVEARPTPLPLARPISSALGTYTQMDCVTLTIHTNDGPSGFGYTVGLGGTWSAAVATYIDQELAPLAVGCDALAPEALWQRLRREFPDRTMPRTVNLITGPSRSADIEQTLILGAHGPRQLHVIVVRD